MILVPLLGADENLSWFLEEECGRTTSHSAAESFDVKELGEQICVSANCNLVPILHHLTNRAEGGGGGLQSNRMPHARLAVS